MQISTKGVISFRDGWTFSLPEVFPTLTPRIQESFVVAPFWSDIDIRNEGNIFYKIYTGETRTGRDLLRAVTSFVSLKQPVAANFSGSWMLVVEWSEVPPFQFVPTDPRVWDSLCMTCVYMYMKESIGTCVTLCILRKNLLILYSYPEKHIPSPNYHRR